MMEPKKIIYLLKSNNSKKKHLSPSLTEISLMLKKAVG